MHFPSQHLLGISPYISTLSFYKEGVTILILLGTTVFLMLGTTVLVVFLTAVSAVTVLIVVREALVMVVVLMGMRVTGDL